MPTTPPYVLALIGLPGAGKSTVARFLLDKFPLHEVNRDSIRHAMFPLCRYSDAENRAAEQAVFAAVKVNCAANLHSLIDGMTFARAGRLQRLRELGDRIGFTLVTVWLDCPPSVARRRVAADQAAGIHPAGDRRPELVDAVAARFEAPPADAVWIDATRPVSEVCAQAWSEVTQIWGPPTERRP